MWRLECPCWIVHTNNIIGIFFFLKWGLDQLVVGMVCNKCVGGQNFCLDGKHMKGFRKNRSDVYFPFELFLINHNFFYYDGVDL
jgi:hypothetical protein